MENQNTGSMIHRVLAAGMLAAAFVAVGLLVSLSPHDAAAADDHAWVTAEGEYKSVYFWWENRGSETDIDRFQYRFKDADKNWTDIAWTDVPDSHKDTEWFRVADVKPGERFEYRVRAVDEAGNLVGTGARGSVLTPRTLTLSGQDGDGKVTFAWEWDNPEDEQAGLPFQYRFQRGSGTSHGHSYTGWKPIPRNKTVKGLENGYCYVFQVRGHRGDTTKAISNQWVGCPTDPPPTIKSMDVRTRSQSGNFNTGKIIHIRVIFSEDVNAFFFGEDESHIANLAVQIGANEREFKCYKVVNVDKFDRVFCQYEVTAEDRDDDGISIGRNKFQIHNAFVYDDFGNELVPDHEPIGDQSDKRVNSPNR